MDPCGLWEVWGLLRGLTGPQGRQDPWKRQLVTPKNLVPERVPRIPSVKPPTQTQTRVRLEVHTMPLGGLVGRGELLPVVSGVKGSQPWARPQGCLWRRKNVPKKKQVTDEAMPCPRVFTHNPEAGSPWPEVEAGGRESPHWSVHLSVRVPGRQTLASSISRKSLCMGTLPCSLTL